MTKGDFASDGFGTAERELKVVVGVGEAGIDIATLNMKYERRTVFVMWSPSMEAHEFREGFRKAVWQLWTDKNKLQ
jgi:predicted neutral ceramidase superfamily lipid hydrolase